MSSKIFRFWLSSLMSISLALPVVAEVSYERKKKAHDLATQAIKLNGEANAQKSLDLFWQAAAMDPEDALLQFDLGISFSKLKRYQEAWKCYQKAVALDPAMADAWVELAQAYADCGDIKRATAMFDDIKRRFPRDAAAIARAAELKDNLTLQTASGTKAGVTTQSLEIYRSETGASPSDLPKKNAYAWALIKAKDYKNALI